MPATRSNPSATLSVSTIAPCALTKDATPPKTSSPAMMPALTMRATANGAVNAHRSALLDVTSEAVASPRLAEWRGDSSTELPRKRARNRVGAIGRDLPEPQTRIETLSLLHDWQSVQRAGADSLHCEPRQ